MSRDSASPPSIALLGAGYTLERVAAKCASQNTIVTARSADRVRELKALGYAAEQLDLADGEQVQRFFARQSGLEVIVDSVPPLRADGIPAAAGVNNIVTSLSEISHSIKKIIYLSTTGVYGVEDGSWVDESHVPEPLHQRGRERLESERCYRTSPVPVCCFRIAAIYGPGRGIGISLNQGRYPYIDQGQRWSNRIHADDLASAIVAAINTEQVLPPAVNLSDNCPAQTSEIVRYYCERFGFALPSSISAEEARNRGMDSLLSNQRISNRLLRETLLPVLAYPDYIHGAGSEF